MKLVIADPPYPPFVGSGGKKNRASRWYGNGQRSATDRPADFHPSASEWDSNERHRQLLLDLMARYDGWAIATSPDGLAAYGDLPVGSRIMAWIKPNACPGSHRILSLWEPVIVYPPVGRRSNRGGAGSTKDVLTENCQRGFRGQKPERWTHWVLDALSYCPSTDSVEDIFSGSGSVAKAVATYLPKNK